MISEKMEVSILKYFEIAAFLLTLLFIIIRVILRKRNKEKNQILVQKVLNYNFAEKIINKRANSIFLFGNFTVFNNKERDISYLFSPKIKQLFLLLLFNSTKENSSGVTSELIYSIIWPDTITEKAKNLKNVTINQLRKILEEIDGIEVVYLNRLFILEFKEDFYCDYFDFLGQLETLKQDFKDEDSLMKLISITRTGPFLKSLEEEYFDKFKNEFESDLMKIISNQLKIYYKNKNYSAIIPMTEILFYIDDLNEMAFYYKIHSLLKMGMVNDAKKCFNNFILTYKKIMNDDFSKTFLEVSKKIPKELFK
jgi:two-component SAPR family response regulator